MRAMIGMAAALALAGCAADEGVDLERNGALMFQQDCAVCHGTDGRGEGSLGRSLIVTPPDLTRIAARNNGLFPLDEVMTAIDGYHRDPEFSAAMPEFGARDLGPLVTLPGPEGQGTPVPLGLLELGRYIESIQRP